MTYKRTNQVILSLIPALLILFALGVTINRASAAIKSGGNEGELLAVGAAGDPVCPVDMVSYWKLEESGDPYVDSFGDHDGANTGVAPDQSPGKFGSGQDVNYANETQGIDIPSHTDFDWGAGDSFSIEFWVQPDLNACQSNSRVVVGRDDGTGIQWWVGCVSGSGNATFQLDDSDGVREEVFGASITDGAWHHIVAVRDGSNDDNHLYVDNVLTSNTDAIYTGDFAAVAPANINIGWFNHRDNGPNLHRFAGVVDEVAIYNKALSASEVAFHFNGGPEGAARQYCNNAPVFTPVVDQSDEEGEVISLDINATDPEEDGITYSAPGLPSGLSIDPSSGLISGTLSVGSAGVYPVTVTATDDGDPNAFNTLSFNWTVTEPNAPPQVTSPGDKTNAEGDVILSLPIVATDPDGDPMTYSALNLPPSLGINTNTGVISGTISYEAFVGSPYAVQVTVSDGLESTVISFNWTITNTNRPPQVTSPGNQSDLEGETVSVLVTASDPDNDNLTFVITGLPPGLSFNLATKVIGGTISAGAAAGSPYSVTVEVEDDGVPVLSDSETFTWTVVGEGEDEFKIFLPVVIKQDG